MSSEFGGGGTEGFAAAVMLLGLVVAEPLIGGWLYPGRFGKSKRKDEPGE